MKSKIFSILLSFIVIFALLTACSPDAADSGQPQADAVSEPEVRQETEAEPAPSEAAAPADVSPDVNQLYVNQNYMLEMLINDSCTVEDDGAGALTVLVPSQNAALLLNFKPGIQNLAASGNMMHSALAATFPNGQLSDLTDCYFFGERAKKCDFFADMDDGTQMGGVGVTSIVNQSMYYAQVIFADATTANEAALITNVLASMNILRPVAVDANTQKAAYQSRYKGVAPAPNYQQEYVPPDEWYYLPYYYYSWWDDYGTYQMYGPEYYEPDWDYYSDGAYWSWGWDTEDDWGFYDDYEDAYGTSAYGACEDYYSDFDPWSDPGDEGYETGGDLGDYDYYDMEADEGGYYEDEYYDDGGGDYYEEEYYDDGGDW